MDMMVLGGGYGTRLFGKYNREKYIPKGLLKIGNSPIIDITLSCFSHSLIDRIILETNKEGEEFYINWMNNREDRSKISIYLDKNSSPNNPHGVLGTIESTIKDCSLDKSPLLIIAPDNFFTENLDNMINYYSNEDAFIATYELEDFSDAKKYGVVKVVKDEIVNCKEKPDSPDSKLIRTSCEIWGERAFSYLEKWNKIYKADRVGDFINYLIDENCNVRSYKLNSFWIDIGSKEDLEKLRRLKI